MIEIIIGSQWGDEGKGKIVDVVAQQADYVVRFSGGNNAGHTVINQYGTFPLHLIPSGIFNPRAKVLISPGVVLDFDTLIAEIQLLRGTIPTFEHRLFISPRAHVIMPYHKLLDRLYEEAKGKAKTGTTGRGIGPVYADKVSYQGIRVGDFIVPSVFKAKLRLILGIKNKIIQALGEKPLKLEEIYQSQMEQFNVIQPFVQETFLLLQGAIKKHKKILMEGAQGVFLDNDWGTYPYVTASNTVSGAITAAAGVAPGHINKITGVVKAYTTRVGAGPFPTELSNKTGERLRAIGHEFGTTTGRARRCGWLDLGMVRFAVALNGFTHLVITKLDVLDVFESIQLCTGYTVNGKKVSYTECDTVTLDKIKPIYKEMQGWNQSIQDCRVFSQLPKEAKRYVQYIERFLGIPVAMISVGPRREQTIVC